MNDFDRADALLSGAMNRCFAAPVEWHPMRYREGAYTTRPERKTAYPDTARPVRGTDQSADPFVAVVVWRPTVVDPGNNMNEQSGVGGDDVMLEFDVRLFADKDTGEIELPTQGDRFRLMAQDGSITTVEMPREAVDDGTERVQIWCNAVSTES